MKLTSNAFADGQPIPPKYAFARYSADNNIALSTNLNPDLSWSDLPKGTRSLVLICHDPDVPSKPDDVNQDDREVPADLPRVDFYHWILVDLMPVPDRIEEGEFADGVVAGGKDGPAGPRATRQGINNYREWFAGDEDMGGNYYGYDGPCPPWNDSIVHHYIFTLYALDCERCLVEGMEFTAADVFEAMDGHILGSASLTGTYSLNPKVPA